MAKSASTRGSIAPRLLPAALELFTRQGFDATSMRQLAEHLGITKPALYYHCASKDELLIRLVEPYLHGVDVLLADPPAGPRRVLEAYLDLLVHHRRVMGLIARDPAVRGHSRVHERVTGQLMRLRGLLVGDAASASDEVRASAAIGALWRPFMHLPAFDHETHRGDLLGAAIAALESRPWSPNGRPGRPDAQQSTA